MRRSRNRVLDAALSGLLVGLLAAGPVLAQQPALRLLPRVLPAAAAPKLIVLVVPLDAPAQAQVPRLTHQAEQLLAGNARFDFVHLSDALDVEGARAREAKAEEAASALKEGLKAYDELDTQKALQQFDKAAQAYELSDLSRHFSDMVRARVMKIASYVANGDNKGFVRELKEMLPRNPNAEFSSNYFPPDELATIEKTRKAIRAEATRSLEVKTGDVVAQVFVDGQFQGFSPVTLSGLTSAEHFVTASAPGYGLAQSKVRGEASLTLQPLPSAQKLKAVVDRIAKSPDGLDRDAALGELGTLAGAQQVVALMVRGSPGVAPQNATAVRVDVADGHNLAYAQASVPLGTDATEAALQSLLGNVLQADAPRVKGKPGHIPVIETGSGRKTAGYVLMGTGVALIAGGVFFGLQASSKADEFKKTPQTSPKAEQLRSDGKTFALFADVGLIAGLVSAGTGAFLAFSGGGGGGKAETPPSRPVAPPPPRPAPSHETKPAPSREPTPAAHPTEKPVTTPAPSREPTPAARPTEKPVTTPAPSPAPATPAPAPTPAPTPPSKPAANAREEEKRKREEEERLKREQEEKKKRDEEEKKKRDEEEKKKREEEEKKKKKPALDEDDLRNY